MKNIRKRTGKSKYFDEPDKFLSFTEKVKIFVMDNPSQAYGALIAIGVVVALTVVAAIMIDASNDRVAALQAEAFEYYDVESPTPGGQPLPEAERYAKAEELFTKLGEKGSSDGAGLIGKLYAANADMKLGNSDKAMQEYQSLYERNSGTIMGALAGIRLASALLDTGRADEAYALASKMADTAVYMRDEALYMKGWISEAMGRNTDAGAAYSKIKTDFPQSPRAPEANARLSKLMEAEMANQGGGPAEGAQAE